MEQKVKGNTQDILERVHESKSMGQGPVRGLLFLQLGFQKVGGEQGVVEWSRSHH